MDNYYHHPEWEDAKQDAELLYIEKGLNLEKKMKEAWLNKTICYLINNLNRKYSKYMPLSMIAEQCGCNYIDFDYFCYLPEYPSIEENLTYNMLMQALTNDEREIIEMHFIGYSYKEISEFYNITNNTARQRIYKIRRKLKIIFIPPLKCNLDLPKSS